MSKILYSLGSALFCWLLLGLTKPNKIASTQELNIEYHQQETGFYCGAACAQMVLHQIGVPHTTNTCADLDRCQNNTDLCQGCLYVESYATSTHQTENWYSYPDGLQNTLNNHRTPEFAAGFRFALFEETDKAIITQKVVWTILHYKVAPIVLVYDNRVNDGLHWITVTGYISSSDPVSSYDDNFKINDIVGFWIHDPWPPVPFAPPAPHSSDDLCGTGDVAGSDRGEGYRFVTLDEWTNHLLTFVSDGHWKNKSIAICDPDKGPKKGKIIDSVVPLFSGEKIIKPKIARLLAIRSLTDLGLLNKIFLPAQISSAKAGKPLLVQRIDRDSDSYYIVPLRGTDDKNHGLVNIDARFGKYKQLSFPKKNGYIRDYKEFSKTEIVTKLKNFLELKFKKMISPFSSKAVTVLPNWIWMPCKESLSPFYPFQVVLYNYKLFYVRIDGQVFDKLSTDGKGM